MDLETVLQHCRMGDALAWEKLVRSYQGRVFGLALHYVQRPEEARDIAQDVFIKIYNHIHLCPPAPQFPPWILTITRNTALDHLRRLAARPASDGIDLAKCLESPVGAPDRTLEAKDRRGLLYRALRKVTALSREMILLKDIQGLSLDEIAAMLKLPLGTVKSRSHRARLELSQELISLKTEGISGAMGGAFES